MALPLYINLDDGNRVVLGQRNLTPITAIRLKGGSATTIEFRFVRGGQVVSLGVAPTFRFAAKAEGERDSDPVLETLNAGFTVVPTDGDYNVVMALDTNTLGLWDLFVIDEDETNDVLIVRLDAELFWQVGDDQFRTGVGFNLILDNPIIRDGDLPPVPVDPAYPEPGVILVVTDIGDTVCPLVGGLVPTEHLPAAPDQTVFIQDYVTSPSAVVASGNSIEVFAPCDMPITEVIAALRVVQTSGSILTVDIKDDGVSILSTLLTIDNTEATSLTAVTPAVVITDTVIAKGSKIKIEVTQIGDGTAAGLYFILRADIPPA